MKWCKKCKKSYPNKNNYCPQCGTKLTNDPLPLGTLFTKEDEDFNKFDRGFTF